MIFQGRDFEQYLAALGVVEICQSQGIPVTLRMGDIAEIAGDFDLEEIVRKDLDYISEFIPELQRMMADKAAAKSAAKEGTVKEGETGLVTAELQWPDPRVMRGMFTASGGKTKLNLANGAQHHGKTLMAVTEYLRNCEKLDFSEVDIPSFGFRSRASSASAFLPKPASQMKFPTSPLREYLAFRGTAFFPDFDGLPVNSTRSNLAMWFWEGALDADVVQYLLWRDTSAVPLRGTCRVDFEIDPVAPNVYPTIRPGVVASAAVANERR